MRRQKQPPLVTNFTVHLSVAIDDEAVDAILGGASVAVTEVTATLYNNGVLIHHADSAKTRVTKPTRGSCITALGVDGSVHSAVGDVDALPSGLPDDREDDEVRECGWSIGNFGIEELLHDQQFSYSSRNGVKDSFASSGHPANRCRLGVYSGLLLGCGRG